MTNPAPRPALRKAPDADIHPAQGQARSTINLQQANDSSTDLSSTTHVADTQIDLRNRPTVAVIESGVVASKPTANPGGSDTEGLQTVAKKSKKSNKGSGKSKGSNKKKSSKKNDKKKKKSGKGKKKKGKREQPGARTSKRIDITAGVPLSVRRALRSGAKARGTSVEDRVDSVVTAWRNS